MKSEKDISIRHLNTFNIEAKAAEFAEFESTEELQEFLKERQEDAPILVIGGGSNLLFLHDFNGLILHSAIKGIEVVEENEDSVVIRVGSGIVWDDLVAETLRQGWYGLENLSIIPGEVGASAVQNIGAYGVEAKDFITEVETINIKTAETKVFQNAECCYAYRYSIFKSPEVRGQYVVTHVRYRLSKTFSPRLEYGGLAKAWQATERAKSAELLRDIIINMREQKLPDPKVLGNAGSFFMNPIVDQETFERLLTIYPDMPHYDAPRGVKIPAGWLIEKSGWKGRQLGPAGVYERQALVLVNHGGATGEDIVRLCKAIQKDVLDNFQISIHPEVNFIR